MLEILFKNYNPVLLSDNKIQIRVTANYSLVITSYKKSYSIEFDSTRTDKGNLNGTKIGSFTTINKTREILNRCIASKKEAIKLALRYVNPIQVFAKVIDPMGNKVVGVNAVNQSEVAEYQLQGYSFVSSAKGEQQQLRIKKKFREFIR